MPYVVCAGGFDDIVCNQLHDLTRAFEAKN
jgi:hypothetical protein